MRYRYIGVVLVIIVLCLFVNYCKNRCPHDGLEDLTEKVVQLRGELGGLKTKMDRLSATRDKDDDDLVYIYDNLSKLWGDMRDAWGDLTRKDGEISNLQKNHVVFNLRKLVEGFQVVDSPSGRVLLAVKDVQPFLDGYKIALVIGNPTCAILQNLKIKVCWNLRPIPEKSNFSQKDALAHESKEKLFTPKRDFEPGRWSRIELYIEPATIEELGRVEFSIEPPTVVLLNDSSM